MTKTDAFLLAAFLVVLAGGAVDIAENHTVIGIVELFSGAGMFGLRAYEIANRPPRS